LQLKALAMTTQKMSVNKIRQFHERWNNSIDTWRREIDQIKKDQSDSYEILRKVRAFVDDEVGLVDRIEGDIEDLEILIDDVDWELRLDKYERHSQDVVDVPHYKKQHDQHENIRHAIIELKRNHELLYKQLQLLSDHIESNLR
jgi:hypothetical protein